MGKFAEPDDVTGRFEGPFPSDRSDWVELRLQDVENALMGVVPELRRDVTDIQNRAELRGDAGYLDRVKTLVCDKVLQLYRNPSGATRRTVDIVTEEWSSGAVITFTSDELGPIRFEEDGRVGSVRLVSWTTC